VAGQTARTSRQPGDLGPSWRRRRASRRRRGPVAFRPGFRRVRLCRDVLATVRSGTGGVKHRPGARRTVPYGASCLVPSDPFTRRSVCSARLLRRREPAEAGDHGFPPLSGRVLPEGEEPPPPPVAPEPLLDPPLPSGGGAPAPFQIGPPPLPPPVPPLLELLVPAPPPLLVDGQPPPLEQSTWATASAAPP
jgi:hypothetical protein